MAKYNTILTEGSGEVKDRGSRFIGYTKYVNGKEEAEAFILSLWKEHPKARHVCYAYLLKNESEYRANDDGEPSGSAGLPILNQIKSADLRYTAIGVVRYFGGTKLGVSGLITAYKLAAKEAIGASVTGEREEMVEVKLTFKYEQMETVMSFVKSNTATVLAQDFGEKCILTLRISLVKLQLYEAYFSNYKIPMEV